MIEVSITDFQGITAEFTLGAPITWIAGPNGSGKSRIARALAAVLSGTTTPTHRQEKRSPRVPNGR